MGKCSTLQVIGVLVAYAILGLEKSKLSVRQMLCLARQQHVLIKSISLYAVRFLKVYRMP